MNSGSTRIERDAVCRTGVLAYVGLKARDVGARWGYPIILNGLVHIVQLVTTKVRWGKENTVVILAAHKVG